MAEQHFHVKRNRGMITVQVIGRYEPTMDELADKVAELTDLPRERIAVERADYRQVFGATEVSIEYDLVGDPIVPPDPAKADADLTTVRIISDPDAEFWRLLIELSNAIKITYGREAEVTIWPKGIPIGAMMPLVVGTYAGMRIVGPATAVARLSRKGA